MVQTETRHSVVLTAGTGVAALLGLAYSVYAGRTLGPAEYGVFTTAVSLVLWCQLALGPINGTVARFSAQYAGEGRPGKIQTLAREVVRRVGWIGLIALVVGLFTLRPLADFLLLDSIAPLIVAYGMVYLTLLLSIARGVLRGVQDFGRYNVNIITEAAVRLVFGVVILELIWGATAGLSAYLIALSCTLALSLVQVRRVWHGHDPERLDGRAVRRFTVPMFVMMFTFAGFSNIDMLCVKHYFPEAAAGVYGAAFTLARVLGTLVTPFTTLMLPLLTTFHAKGQARAGAFLRICGFFLALAAVPMGLFWLWPDEIIAWAYREEYAEAAPLLLAMGAARLSGYLAFMIVLAGAAANSFRSLYVYVPGLLVQGVVLVLWHGRLADVIAGVLIVQAMVFVLLLPFAVYNTRVAAGKETG